MRELRKRLEGVAGARLNRALVERLAAAEADLSRLLPGSIVRTPSGEHFTASSHASPRPKSFSDDALAILAGHPQARSIPPDRWLFLDTETTGLAGGTGTYAFLVGLAQWVDGRFRVEQHFMRNYAEEQSLLEAVSERLTRAELLITFNGKTFDLPLLETRFRLARRQPPTEHLVHLDLLYPARQLWKTRLGTVRLTELERHMLGRAREGDIPGELIPQIYFDYLRQHDPQPLVAVFRHNRYDLEALAELLACVLDLVEATETPATVEPTELFGLSRLLENRGVLERSRQYCERAIEQGLPAELEPTALRRLAGLCKRTRDFARATPLWERWSRCDRMSVQPEIELAIYHEHRNRDFAAALEAVRRALAKLQRAAAVGAIEHDSLHRQRRQLEYRLARLKRKQARSQKLSVQSDN